MDEEKLSMEDLLLSGIIEVAAIDSETGELLYSFTDKVKEYLPALYEIHINHVHNEIMYFWEKGFVKLDDFENKNPIVSLTEKAFNLDEVSKLSNSKQAALNELKRILKVI